VVAQIGEFGIDPSVPLGCPRELKPESDVVVDPPLRFVIVVD